MTNSNLSNSSPSSPASSRTIQSGSSMQSCLNSTLICLSYGSLLSKLTAQQNSLSSNPSTASVTVATTTATGVDKSSVVPSALHQKSDRLIQSGLFQGSVPSPVPSSPSAIISSSSIAHHQHQHKMTGGIRRTVSSATPCSTGMGSMNTSARPVHQQAPIGVTKSLSSNTQQTAVRGAPATHISTKDPHKKLDRSFSEPAEKKGASAAAAAAAAAAASSLGPSSRYKTELCRSFAEVGSCKYGDKCQFAHGEEELRTVSRHPKFKTENCKSFHSTGFCPYGPRCHFIHNDESGKKINSSNSSSSSSAVPSSPSAIVGSQRMFEPVIGAPNNSNQSVNQHNVPVTSFASTSPSAVLNNNLVRPKALSLGSYSLGSSGEISSPSSQSGSPTSLNSFFTEDSGILSGTPFCLSGSNSRLHSNALTSAFPPPASNNQHQNPHSPFSFSPDSAFVSFNGTNSNSGSNSSTSSGSSMSFGGSQKCIFGGSQPTLSSRFSPVEQCLTNSDETANSVLYSLFGSTPFGHPDHHNVQQHQQFSDLYRTMSPIGKPSQLHYPLAPESPVDSVASEIEALKLGEPHLSAFAPISPSFSTSSLSTASSSPPLNSGSMLMHQQQQSELEQALNASGAFGAVHIPRLPTFTKFATTIGGQLTNIAHE